MNEFKIRAYGRMELAQLYSPELTDIAAYRKMKKWISLCPGLLQRLYDLGYESKRRSFTPLEVRVIHLLSPINKRKYLFLIHNP